MQALVWQRNARENQNFTVTNVSSIPLCISYYADNDDKDNPNITCGLSCTWQTPNCTTADRIFLLCESEKQTSMAENSFNCFWCARCTKMLSKCDFKHANCLLSLTTCQGIPASVPSTMSWMNARYEAMTVGREMFLWAIIHQGLENIWTFSSRWRPRPFFMSSRRLETKTKVARLHSWYDNVLFRHSTTAFEFTFVIGLYIIYNKDFGLISPVFQFLLPCPDENWVIW